MATRKNLGKYELHEEIGRGGFGTVYRATDSTLKRDVALKVLHPQLTVEADFLEKFRNEAHLIAALDNPHIVTIYELGEAEGRVFIAMRYMAGGSLKDRLAKEGALPFEETLRIIKQVCDGLQTAHEQVLIHRDIKPANILFDQKGNAVISDFGLAKAVQHSSVVASSSLGVVGTPAYQAPELWRGKPPASPATDIYSLGCVLSEMLSGRVLFDGDTPDEIIRQHLVDGPNIPQSYPEGVPKGMQQVLRKALAKEPKARYQSTTELAAAMPGALKPKHESVEAQPATRAERQPGAAREAPREAASQKQAPCKKDGGKLTPVWLTIGLVGIMVVCIIFAINRQASAPAVEPIDSMVSEKDGMTLVYVPSGKFLMGSDENISLAGDDEKPQHMVCLDAFWIDQTEVSNAQYAFCVADGTCSRPSSNTSWTHDSYYGNAAYDDYPVIYVSWYQANDYCEWAGRRLPTEAEWEKAARGTDGRSYPWGEDINCDLANYDYCVGDTTVVGSYPAGASPYGALDMAGNVWEWTADWYDSGYYSESPSSNPSGPSSGEYRIVRGGSWGYSVSNIRSASRCCFNPYSRNYFFGFRCARGTSP